MNRGKFLGWLIFFSLLAQNSLYSQEAGEEISVQSAEDTVADKVGDWFAVFGKAKEERTQILRERKAKRRALRLERKTGFEQAETKQEKKQLRQEYKQKDKTAREEFKSSRQQMKQKIENEKPKWGPDRKSLKYQGKGKSGG